MLVSSLILSELPWGRGGVLKGSPRASQGSRTLSGRCQAVGGTEAPKQGIRIEGEGDGHTFPYLADAIEAIVVCVSVSISVSIVSVILA